MQANIGFNKKVILFDGVCNLCNTSVVQVIKFDKKGCFLFAPIQSKSGKRIISYLQINIKDIDSVILYEPKVSFDIKSSAALKIMSEFGGLWKLTQVFWIFPRPIRDFVYDFIAKNRYKWFGKRQSCMIPTPELKSKFLA